MSVALFCGKCGTWIDDDASDPCDAEKPAPRSGFALFVAESCVALERGASIDEAAEDARDAIAVEA